MLHTYKRWWLGAMVNQIDQVFKIYYIHTKGGGLAYVMVNQTDQVFKIYYIHTKGGGLAQWLIKLHLKLKV
jgi:hypothetical protein